MNIKKLVGFSILLTIAQLLCVGIVSANVVETGPRPDLLEPSLKDPKPAKMQQKIIPVESMKKSHLVATLYQSDSREWFYDLAPIQYGPFKNLSTPEGDVPVKLDVEAIIEVDSPLYDPSDAFLEKSGKLHPVSRVPNKNRKIRYVKTLDRDIDDIPPKVSKFTDKNGNFSTFMSVGGNTSGVRKDFGKKTSMAYFLDLEILWQGTLIETKEIDVVEDAVLKIGGTKQEKATVKTQKYEGEEWETKDVTSITDEITWKSSNELVATVSPKGGLVTAVSKGKTTITATWTDKFYTLIDSATITVGDGPTDPIDPDPVLPECTVPAPGQSIIGKYMDPVVTAMIRADARGSEQFDVLQGIPTTESLYGNVFARNYLYQDEFVQMTGSCTFTVSVNKEYTLKWDPGKPGKDSQGKPITVPDPQSDTESRTYQYKIVRPYAFWKIKNLEVYKIDQASLVNYALPNAGIIIQPTGYTPPYYSASTTGNYYRPSPPSEVQAPGEIKSGGKSRPSVPNDQGSLQGVAEKAVEKIEVENDSLDFNGQKIMNNQRVKETGPTPSQIPAPQPIGENVLYSPGNMISNTKVNKKDTPSSGVIKYALMSGNINGGSDKQFAINGINTITVHTPVVDYSSVTDDQEHNQKTIPNFSRAAFILDRPFSVTIPTVGQHQSYKNYGYRDYRKWTKDRQVQFPFGVLSRKDDNSSYIAPGTWVSFPDGVDTLTFYMPVWIDEGDYNVYTRAIAENAPEGFTTETDANMNWVNHVATRTIEVEVIGRVYDFRVTDIADYNWESVFRTSTGSNISNGKFYPVGEKGIDGDPNGIVFPYELPIRRGSHPNPEFKNIAVKTGYHFKFDLKSKGNMFGTYDSIRITPTFTFVDFNGNRQPVDLYYNTENQRFIKIGSTADVQKRYVTLDSRLRNIPHVTLQNTAETLYDLFAKSSGWSMNKAQYTTSYLAEAQKKTYIGGYDVELITAPLRTLIGGFNVPNGVPAERKSGAVQQWYGEYSLPAAPYVVKKGFNIAEYGRTNKLDDKSSIFLKKGFIVVNFDIETIQKGELNKPHLQYIHTGIAKANQWKREGFNYQFTDPYGMKVNLYDGDVVFYNADKSSYDDFGQSGTH